MNSKSNELTGNNPEVRAALGAAPSPGFSVKKDELAGFVKGHLSPDHLVVFSFGLDEAKEIVLFVDIKDRKGNVIKTSEMIQKGNSSLLKPVNEPERKKNYINSLGGLPGKRDGICHAITSSDRANPGLNDFIAKHPGDILYIYTGKGNIAGESGDYTKLYFSFHDKIRFSATEVLYNRGGACCPPDPPPPPPTDD